MGSNQSTQASIDHSFCCLALMRCRPHLVPGEPRNPGVGSPLAHEDAVADAWRKVLRLGADERAHRQDHLESVIPDRYRYQPNATRIKIRLSRLKDYKVKGL